MPLLKNRVFILIVAIIILGAVWIAFYEKISKPNESLITPEIPLESN